MRHDTVLTGRRLTLRPLTWADDAALAALVDDEVWAWLVGSRPTGDGRWVQAAWEAPGRLAFAAELDGEVVGSTSYHDHEPAHRATCVGYTFWARRCWADGLTNPEAKLLMLGHAFDDLGMLRVGLRTDHLNVRSQAAIERLGAVKEGVIRSHLVRDAGGRRDSVLYGILAAEWPAVRRGLEGRLGW